MSQSHHQSYVYPKGITGQVLGGMIEYTNQSKIIYIDDNLPNQGLEQLQSQIKKERARVHLGWNKIIKANDATIAKLKAKLDGFGIEYEEDSVFIFAKKVVSKLQQQIQKRKWNNIIGIELCGIAQDKHIGFVDDWLIAKSQGRVQIVYLCATLQSYAQISQKIANSSYALAVCLPCEYSYLIDFFKALIKTSATNKSNPKVPTLYVGHSLSDWSLVDCKTYFDGYFDYFCVGLESFAPKAQNFELLPSGYLGFDKIIAEAPYLTQEPSTWRGGGIFYLLLMTKKNFCCFCHL